MLLNMLRPFSFVFVSFEMTGVNITRFTIFRYSLNWLDDRYQIVEGEYTVLQ